MDLSNIMDGAILLDSWELSPLKELALLSVLEQLNGNPFLIFIILRNKELRIPTLAGPELVALISPILPSFASAYYHGHILF